MRIFITLLILLSAISLSFAEIYKWTDSKGEVHFSDKPHPGAQPVNLPPVQTYSPEKIAPIKQAGSDEDQSEQKNQYKFIKIVEPPNETTSRDNQGRVPVVVETSPPLKPGDKIQILLDGMPLGEPQESTSFLLNNVYRGTHTINAQIVDNKGNILLQTIDPTMLFMHRPRTGMTSNTPPPRGR